MFRRSKTDKVRERYQACIKRFLAKGDVACLMVLLSIFFEYIPELFLFRMADVVEFSL